MNQQSAERSKGKCELCESEKSIRSYKISELADNNNKLAVCEDCFLALEGESKVKGNQWRKLEESVWSEHPAVQVAAYRLLHHSDENWAKECMEMVYIDEELKKAALSGQKQDSHFDSNGQVLQDGDSVSVIKDLDVKGSSLVVKRGTVARNIRLVSEDPTHILAKVEGQTLYLKTDFLKKQ